MNKLNEPYKTLEEGQQVSEIVDAILKLNDEQLEDLHETLKIECGWK